MQACQRVGKAHAQVKQSSGCTWTKTRVFDSYTGNKVLPCVIDSQLYAAIVARSVRKAIRNTAMFSRRRHAGSTRLPHHASKPVSGAGCNRLVKTEHAAHRRPLQSSHNPHLSRPVQAASAPCLSKQICAAHTPAQQPRHGRQNWSSPDACVFIGAFGGALRTGGMRRAARRAAAHPGFAKIVVTSSASSADTSDSAPVLFALSGAAATPMSAAERCIAAASDGRACCDNNDGIEARGGSLQASRRIIMDRLRASMRIDHIIHLTVGLGRFLLTSYLSSFMA